MKLSGMVGLGVVGWVHGQISNSHVVNHDTVVYHGSPTCGALAKEWISLQILPIVVAFCLRYSEV